MRLGILSDTHGQLREAVLERLAGCDRLLHAGDVGDPAILRRLEGIAPTVAVRGNTDEGPLAKLPATASGDAAGIPWRMVHRAGDVPNTWERQARLVVYGHSHRPELSWRGDCLFLNPGACGARRFKLPLTVAVVQIVSGRLVPEILSVEDLD